MFERLEGLGVIKAMKILPGTVRSVFACFWDWLHLTREINIQALMAIHLEQAG